MPYKTLTKRRAQHDKYKAAHPERMRAYSLKHARKGLPAPTRPEPNACEICGAVPGRRLALDHCHIADVFRGWICSACNLMLGNARDTPGILEAGAAYLRRVAASLRK